jgi:hypothetical protein
MKAAKTVETVDEARQVAGDAVIFYSTQEHYERLTKRSGMLREWKVAYPSQNLQISQNSCSDCTPQTPLVPQKPFLSLASIFDEEIVQSPAGNTM